MFRNQKQAGTIIVRKETVPAGGLETFTFTGAAAETIAHGGTIVVGNLPAGTYTSTESVKQGWDLTSIACNDSDSSGNTSTRAATFKLAAGESVTCTFTNTKHGRVSVTKTVGGVPPAGSQSFTFQVRQGASPANAGTILESQNASAANGGILAFTTTLVAGSSYALCEVVPSGWSTTLGPPTYTVYNPAGDSGTRCTDFSVQPGETKTFTIDNTPPTSAAWCQKQPVQDVLNPTSGRFPGNQGPDIIVRTDLGQSVQSAVDSVADANSDGYQIVAVVSNGSGQLGGSSTQSVVISRNYPKTFALIGCSVTLKDPTPGDANPTISIASGANSPGNIFLMDLHGVGSSAAGILVNGNGRYLRNEYALESKVGFKVLGNGNTIHNGQGTDNTGDGVYVQGEGNTITDVDAFSNKGHGFHVVGNTNQLLKLDAGDKGKGNVGDGLHLVGNGNVVTEPGAFANGGDGIDITGTSNALSKGTAGDSGKGNGGDGVRISGAGNSVNESKASANGGNGYNVSGGSAASPNKLKKSVSNTGVSGNTKLENAGAEYVLLNSVRNDGGENKADSITVPKTSNPTKCTTFPATNVTATFAAASLCE